MGGVLQPYLSSERMRMGQGWGRHTHEDGGGVLHPGP